MIRNRTKYEAGSADEFEIELKNGKVYVIPDKNKVIVSTRKAAGSYIIKRSASWNPDDGKRDDSIAYIHVLPSKSSPTGSDQLTIGFDESQRVSEAVGEIRIRSLTDGEAIDAKTYLRQLKASIAEQDWKTAMAAARLLNYRLFDDQEFGDVTP